MKTYKALVLLSGGLDSMLAAKILMEQGVEVTGLIFKSYFFKEKNGVKAARQLKIPYRVIDFSKEHLKMVKKPPHGYGSAVNPCLDCHLLMLKKAKEIMAKKKYDFVATGEVLGERPFSQNKKALEIITKESGLEDRLLRPLSAKLLSPTLPEKKGWINGKKMLEIQGRRRQPQMELAKKYGFTYPSPGGGCVLCEKEFAKRLFDLFKKKPDCDGDDIELLFLGRHFWHGQTKIVLGKNQEENEKLEKMAKKGDVIIKPINFPGPTALIRGGKNSPNLTRKTKSLIRLHSKKLLKKGSFRILTKNWSTSPIV